MLFRSFKGARKNTPFAAQSAARNAAVKAIELGMEKVEVVIKGRGNGRETIQETQSNHLPPPLIPLPPPLLHPCHMYGLFQNKIDGTIL